MKLRTGNRIYFLLFFLFYLFLFSSCERTDLLAVISTDPPVPGGSGSLSFSFVGDTEVRLTWVEGTHSSYSQSSLSYRVYYSLTNNIGTLSEVLANGTAATSWTKGINSQTVKNINVNTTYFFNVVISDPYNNRSTYLMNSSTTLPRQWADTNYIYRKALRVANPASDYPMTLTVYRNDGYDLPANSTVDCEGNSNNDFLDLLFTGSDKVTLLDYFIADTSAGNYCTVRIKTKGENTIYMYYGNSWATTASSGPLTYPDYFDDWVTDSTGSFNYVNSNATASPNRHQWALSTPTFSGARTLVAEGTIPITTYVYAGYDYSVIGFTQNDTDNYEYGALGTNNNYAGLYFEHRTSNVSDATHIYVKLRTKVNGAIKNTALTDIGSIAAVQGKELQVTLQVSSSQIRYHIRNVTDNLVLADFTLTDPLKIPDITLIPHLFVGIYDSPGGSFAYSAPTYLSWTNDAFNGGMTFLVDYWHVGPFMDLEPIWSAIDAVENY